jgi:hypothetical protein
MDILASILAVAALIFLFWDDPSGTDNWDKLNAIIEHHYQTIEQEKHL